MGYFLELLTGSDLDNIYWMGMPHDDLFEIINTVKPSEKYAGKLHCNFVTIGIKELTFDYERETTYFLNLIFRVINLQCCSRI